MERRPESLCRFRLWLRGFVTPSRAPIGAVRGHLPPWRVLRFDRRSGIGRTQLADVIQQLRHVLARERLEQRRHLRHHLRHVRRDFVHDGGFVTPSRAPTGYHLLLHDVGLDLQIREIFTIRRPPVGTDIL